MTFFKALYSYLNVSKQRFHDVVNSFGLVKDIHSYDVFEHLYQHLLYNSKNCYYNWSDLYLNHQHSRDPYFYFK